MPSIVQEHLINALDNTSLSFREKTVKPIIDLIDNILQGIFLGTLSFALSAKGRRSESFFSSIIASLNDRR